MTDPSAPAQPWAAVPTLSRAARRASVRPHIPHFIHTVPPMTFSTILVLSLVSSSFPLFPLTDKRTLNDPKSHRKSHFMSVLFLLGIPGSPWLAFHGCGVKGRES